MTLDYIKYIILENNSFKLINYMDINFFYYTILKMKSRGKK